MNSSMTAAPGMLAAAASGFAPCRRLTAPDTAGAEPAAPAKPAAAARGVAGTPMVRQRGVRVAGHAYAKRVDVNDATVTAVRVGAGLPADVAGARAWSPPV